VGIFSFEAYLGELAGQLAGKDIYLDGTAPENAGCCSQNLCGVTRENFALIFRRKNALRALPALKTKPAFELR